MKFARWTSCLAALLAVALLPAVGCSKKDDQQAKGDQPKVNKDDPKDPKKDGKIDITKESAAHGWWCEEHGVVEEDCSLCLPENEVKKRFKDKGDWCKEHERAKSQCFLCDPGLYEKVWEPKYVAKYNKKPTRPPESEFKKK